MTDDRRSRKTSASASVLVVDDEPDHIDLVRRSLEVNRYDVIAAADGQSAVEIAQRHKPDVILLDVVMPGMNGLDVCKVLRSNERTERIPVILLSALGSEVDRVVGLEVGADDYVTKPFSPRELGARIRAVLRRFRHDDEPPMIRRCGALALDGGRRELTLHGRRVPITETEFRLLEFLFRHPGRALSREEILAAVHPDDIVVSDRTIDVHVSGIRRKLGDGGIFIETLRGFGYRLRDEPASVPRRRSPGRLVSL